MVLLALQSTIYLRLYVLNRLRLHPTSACSFLLSPLNTPHPKTPSHSYCSARRDPLLWIINTATRRIDKALNEGVEEGASDQGREFHPVALHLLLVNLLLDMARRYFEWARGRGCKPSDIGQNPGSKVTVCFPPLNPFASQMDLVPDTHLVVALSNVWTQAFLV